MNRVYDRYLEAEVLNANPLKLVQLLYRGATSAVREARQKLAEGDVRGRAGEINRAWRILQELMDSLDRDRGGEISRRLAALYAYMQTRLVEANSRQADAPLQEVEKLLSSLGEAWDATVQAAGFEPQSAREPVALAVG